MTKVQALKVLGITQEDLLGNEDIQKLLTRNCNAQVSMNVGSEVDGVLKSHKVCNLQVLFDDVQKSHKQGVASGLD